jgi:hypothetical protein
MTGLEIVETCVASCELADCNKFEGHLAVEILKQALAEEGVRTSSRDVFVKGLPIEWDLILPTPGAVPLFNGLLYEASQVVVGIEVKLSGVVGKTLLITRRNFALAKAQGVPGCYVAFCDRKRAAATDENLGFPCFNLTWSLGGGKREDTGAWPRFVDFLLTAERKTRLHDGSQPDFLP